MSYTNTRLFDMLTTVLDVVAARFTADAVSIPIRQYVTFGPVVIFPGCPALVVSYGRTFTGQPGNENLVHLQHTGTVRSVEYTVTLARCVPTVDNGGNAPAAAALNESAQEVLVDAYLIVDAIVQACRAGGALGSCERLTIVRAEPLGPDGGMGGVNVVLQEQI